MQINCSELTASSQLIQQRYSVILTTEFKDQAKPQAKTSDSQKVLIQQANGK